MWITLERTHKVKTRKEHVCDGCGRAWPAGTLMETWTGLWAGEEPPARIYACRICIRFWDETADTSGATFDRLLPERNLYRYIQTEAKLALYVIAASVTPMAARR